MNDSDLRNEETEADLMAHDVDHSEGEGPEWQPWTAGSIAFLIIAILAALALVAVFVDESFPH